MAYNIESLIQNTYTKVAHLLPDVAWPIDAIEEQRIKDRLRTIHDRQKGMCARTGIPLFNEYTARSWNNRIFVEPVDPGKQLSLSNLQFCCRVAPDTWSRPDHHTLTFLKWCVTFLRRKGYTVIAPQGPPPPADVRPSPADTFPLPSEPASGPPSTGSGKFPE